MVLHHELTVPVGRLHRSGKLKVHVPVRKIVRCRMHDLQQSLMCKLGRATQNFQATEGALLVRSLGEESPFDVVGALASETPLLCRNAWFRSHPLRAAVHPPGLSDCGADDLRGSFTALEAPMQQLRGMVPGTWYCS